MIRRIAWFTTAVVIAGTLALALRHATAQDAPADPAPAAAEQSKFTPKEDASYAFGAILAYMAMNPRQPLPIFVDLDEKQFLEGFNDARDRQDPRVDQAQFEAVINGYVQQWAVEKAAANKAAGDKFLEANAEADDVKTTESGLQYKVLKEGKGAHPQKTDEVTVHYTGKLLDGKVFDSSHRRGQPATFKLNRVIPGWTEGLQLMKPGGKMMFYIPGKLAYGNSPQGPGGPQSMLTFEVELIEVGASEEATAE